MDLLQPLGLSGQPRDQANLGIAKICDPSVHLRLLLDNLKEKQFCNYRHVKCMYENASSNFTSPD